MALSIDKSYKTLTLSYWRVLQVNVNENGSGRVSIAGYRSETERNDDSTSHYEVRGYSVSSDEYDTYFAPSVVSSADTNRVSKAYEYLKTEHSDEWGSATDV